jgi:flagella basal body P-ring formation protein FlgA
MKSIVLWTTSATLVAGGGDEKGKPATSLRLRASVAARGLDVTIGELCEVPGDAAGLALAVIKFGPAPVSGYTRTVGRTEVVQALASAGVDVTTFKVEGADEATVQGVCVEVSTHEMIDAATAALQAQLAVEGGDVEFDAPARVRQIQAPPGRQSQELRARVRGTATGVNSAVVDVEVLVDGQSCKKVPLTFKLQRYHQVLKTNATVRAGTPLGPDVLGLAREPLDQSTGLFLDRMEQIEGQVAARNLQPNQRLTLGDVAPPALVHRGDLVTIVLTRGRVKVTAKGLANHDAALGARCAVTNQLSRSTVTGVVQGPGLVVVPQ